MVVSPATSADRGAACQGGSLRWSRSSKRSLLSCGSSHERVWVVETGEARWGRAGSSRTSADAPALGRGGDQPGRDRTNFLIKVMMITVGLLPGALANMEGPRDDRVDANEPDGELPVIQRGV